MFLPRIVHQTLLSLGVRIFNHVYVIDNLRLA
jgi:hypothetical protein